MDIQNDPQSGFDFEVLFSHRLITYVAQLLLDTNDLPNEFTFPGFGNINAIKTVARKGAAVRRAYEPHGNYVYQQESIRAFDAVFLDFPRYPSVKDKCYLRLRLELNVAAFFLYLELPKETDMQRLGLDFTADVQSMRTQRFNLLDYFKVVAVLPVSRDGEFDPRNPDNLMLGITQDIRKMINDQIVTMSRDLVRGAFPSVSSFLGELVSPLGMSRIDKLHLLPLDGGDVMGCAFNLVLLHHDKGYVKERGDIKKLKKSYLEKEEDISVVTGPGIARHLAADLLMKTAVKHRIHLPKDHDEHLTLPRIINYFEHDHFPLRLTRSFVMLYAMGKHEPEASREGVLINGITSEIRREEIKHNDRTVTRQVLRLDVAADTANGFTPDVPGNIILDAFPFIEKGDDGIPRCEIIIKTDMRVDSAKAMARSASSAFNAMLLAWGDRMFLSDEQQLNFLDLVDLPLRSFTLSSKKWDPFYFTHHQLIWGAKQVEFTDNRFGMTANCNLGKELEVSLDTVLRDVETEDGKIKNLLFYTSTDLNTINTQAYATDRLSFTALPKDKEKFIYRIPLTGAKHSAVSRIAAGLLRGEVGYKPMCKRMDEDDDAIARLGLFSLMEFRGANAIEGIDPKKYMRQPGVVRLSLTPTQIKRLIDLKIITLPGFHSVQRNGKLFFRGNPDDTEDNNLDELPDCQSFGHP